MIPLSCPFKVFHRKRVRGIQIYNVKARVMGRALVMPWLFPQATLLPVMALHPLPLPARLSFGTRSQRKEGSVLTLVESFPCLPGRLHLRVRPARPRGQSPHKR